MHADYWRKRWQDDQIGWHQPEPNRFLEQYWKSSPDGGVVLVPLCGKSNDMRWLVDAGHDVIGVELSEIAVTDFFEANDLTPDVENQGPLTVYSLSLIHI